MPSTVSQGASLRDRSLADRYLSVDLINYLIHIHRGDQGKVTISTTGSGLKELKSQTSQLIPTGIPSVSKDQSLEDDKSSSSLDNSKQPRLTKSILAFHLVPPHRLIRFSHVLARTGTSVTLSTSFNAQSFP